MAEKARCLRCRLEYGKGQCYCIGCGAPVLNRCQDEGGLLRDPCGRVCEPNETFCKSCGSPTAFAKAGLLGSPYAANPVLESDELAEMNWFSHPFFLN